MTLTVPARRRTSWLVAGAISIASLSGCASKSSDDSGATKSAAPSPAVSVKTVTAEPPAEETTTAPAEESSDDSGSGGGDSWTMPNEVGMDLQDAQNDIQDLTDYAIAITKSKDASGQDRFQILDHDWKVCSQNVQAGSKIVEGTKIVFNVVKQDETCP